VKSQIIPILREDSWQSASLVERTPAAFRAVFFFLTLLVSIASYLGYREIQQNRQMHDELGRQLAKLEDQVLQNSKQHSGFAEADRDLRANLTLPTKLWSEFNGGVCLISGSYISRFA
jgi:hypothetical protein